MESELSEEGRLRREIDIRTVDKTTLTDIKEIKIDTTQPVKRRIESYIRQVSNPYCVLVGDIAVKFVYSQTTDTLNDKLKEYLTHDNNG